MAEQPRDGGGLLDLEGELTCSICTDLLYAPLTLLDCLHSFCGSCLKEWFVWQATANGRKAANPYTCPSCRESVRDTKVDWRVTTLLEGFLKANPGRGKTDEEKTEASKQYKPGDNVIPPVQIDNEDSEDERLLADVRDLSMTDVDPETARRRAERERIRQERRRQERTPRHRQQQERSHRRHEGANSQGRHVEHQPSIRSLLSDSDIASEDVQHEILQSIYSEGLLNGIDVDNLTAQQEEELTERIAEAYRRRQRNRDRSRARDGVAATHRSSSSNANQIDQSRTQPDSPDRLDTQQQQQQQPSRVRPPIARPHLFEQASASSDRAQRRSASSSSHQRLASDSATARSEQQRHPARSATDLSQTLSPPQQRPRASSSNARSTTDPSNMRNDVQRIRNDTGALHPGGSRHPSRPRSRESASSRRRRDTTPTTGLDTAAAATTITRTEPLQTPVEMSVRPAVSMAAFAPEVVSAESAKASMDASELPSISCSRCQREHIENKVHYRCSKCDSGAFYLCMQCYRSGKGCDHWYGFGFIAMHVWQRQAPSDGYPRAQEQPHVLIPQRYITTTAAPSAAPYPDVQPAATPTLQQGAFCDSCSTFANDCYWYCEVCLFGAWGFCNPCIFRGKHCTHPLLPLAHISALQNFRHDPSKLDFLPVPHLKDHSYVLRPILTDCDICRQEIPTQDARFHCYACNDGDYDICDSCYTNLLSTGKIADNGWRHCLQQHRMAVVGYRNTPYGGGLLRVTLADPVGGWRLRDDPTNTTARPPPSTLQGQRYLATWSWFPDVEAGGSKDELMFPQDAEIREGQDLNEDWAVGVYAGKVGVFPRNHAKRI